VFFLPRLRLLLGLIAFASVAWALALVAGYGQSFSIAGFRISSRNPSRPLLLCAVAGVGYALVSGRARLRQDFTLATQVLQRLAAIGGEGVRLIEAHVKPAPLAMLLAAASVGIAFSFRESTAGGSDAFSYVTQADLWIARAAKLRIEMPIAAAAPWPNAFETFTPFGYRATADSRAVVPVTAPGLPMLMSAFGMVGGHCAMSWVVPLTGGLLVWSTFLIGRRMGSEVVGLGAAWLVATSPTFLSMSRSIMSDAPAAAFWALAIAALLRRSPVSALTAGLSASAAILIRPNLLPVGGVLAAWMIWQERRAPTDGRAARLIAFAFGLIPGCVAIAAINSWLYGSPAASGYGNLNNLFSANNIGINLRRYARWLAETQTPLVLAGAATLPLPWRRIWKTADSRSVAQLLALVTVTVVALYAAYTPFGDWWYLRFLLPIWPAIFIGTVALVVGVAQGRDVWIRATTAIAILALGIYGIRAARQLGVYPPGEGERRYATIAELVARVTEPSAAIITTAHVGPLRYYGGRLTVRYDVMDPAWLDRALTWLEQEGRRPYILLEEQEVQEFSRRFAATSLVARLEMTPLLVYEAHRIGGRVFLFDPRNAAATTWQPAPIEDPQPRCPAPAATPPDYSVK
jgi:hypothetical protein